MITFPFTRSTSNDHVTGRSLVLIDLENLVEGSANADRVQPVIAQLSAQPWFSDGSLVICGSGPALARHAMFQVPSTWRYIIGRGIDGADRALIDAALCHLDRVGRLVIASGDHAFTFVAARMPRAQVTVMSNRHALSRPLARCAAQCLFLSAGASGVPVPSDEAGRPTASALG